MPDQTAMGNEKKKLWGRRLVGFALFVLFFCVATIIAANLRFRPAVWLLTEIEFLFYEPVPMDSFGLDQRIPYPIEIEYFPVDFSHVTDLDVVRYLRLDATDEELFVDNEWASLGLQDKGMDWMFQQIEQADPAVMDIILENEGIDLTGIFFPFPGDPFFQFADRPFVEVMDMAEAGNVDAQAYIGIYHPNHERYDEGIAFRNRGSGQEVVFDWDPFPDTDYPLSPFLVSAAEANNPYAMARLGRHLVFGRYPWPNPSNASGEVTYRSIAMTERGVSYLLQAGHAGHPESILLLYNLIAMDSWLYRDFETCGQFENSLSNVSDGYSVSTRERYAVSLAICKLETDFIDDPITWLRNWLLIGEETGIPVFERERNNLNVLDAVRSITPFLSSDYWLMYRSAVLDRSGRVERGMSLSEYDGWWSIRRLISSTIYQRNYSNAYGKEWLEYNEGFSIDLNSYMEERLSLQMREEIVNWAGVGKK